MKAEDIKLALLHNDNIKESLEVCLAIIQDQQVKIDCLTERIEKEIVPPVQLFQELERIKKLEKLV